MGIALALPSGRHLTKGNQEIVVLAFIAASPVANSDTIEFGDHPIIREVVDVNANSKALSGATDSNELIGFPYKADYLWIVRSALKFSF